MLSAEYLHFGKAAQACNLSPSALTRSIQRLEAEVKEVLVLRDNRSVQLTPAGEQFKLYAAQTIREWVIFKEGVKSHGGVSGTLSLYSSVTAAYSVLADLLEKYRFDYPEVHIELKTGAPEDAIEAVSSGEVDVSVAVIPDQQYPLLEFHPIIETDLVFVAMKNDSSLFMKHELLDVSQVPLILAQSGIGRKRIDQWFKKNQIDPVINTEVSGNEGILALVRLGCGVGVVPRVVLDQSPVSDDLVVIPTRVKVKPLRVGLCTMKRHIARSSIDALWKLASA